MKYNDSYFYIYKTSLQILIKLIDYFNVNKYLFKEQILGILSNDFD